MGQRKVKAEEDGRVALISMQAKAEVMKIEVRTQLQRTKTQLETYRIKEMANAESECNVLKTSAELEKLEAVIEADWKEDSMKSDAQAIKNEASAQQSAGTLLSARRQH